jgi:hypothetical protein
MIHNLDGGEPVRGVVYLTRMGNRVTYSKSDTNGNLFFRYVDGKEQDSFWLSPEHFYRWMRVAPIAVQVPE